MNEGSKREAIREARRTLQTTSDQHPAVERWVLDALLKAIEELEIEFRSALEQLAKEVQRR